MEGKHCEDLRAFLVQTKVDVLAKDGREVIAISESCSVSIALKTLAAHKFLAAPVLSHHENEEEREIVCFLDVRDILLNYLRHIEEAFSPKMANSMLQRMRTLEEKGAAFSQMPVSDLAIKGGDGGFWHTKQAAKASVMELICKGFLSPSSCVKPEFSSVALLDHMHRVALFGDDGASLTNIITQSDIVRFLLHNMDKCPLLANSTVEDLGWLGKSVITVLPELPALDALKIMAANKIGAVGVEKDGRLIGNFSMTDLRAITSEHFSSLSLPVGEFLALEHGTEYGGYACATTGVHTSNLPQEHQSSQDFARSRAQQRTPGADVGQSLILCEKDWTLPRVMELMTCNRIHRLYVVGSVESASPITGLITMSDILK
eukprot:CAMPEP_0177775112 /NCGR_PEP_ID=MMETSP0491_2-20121128/13907_1 /TAXON_ID=63592 /ORGANISM="Tetraselmis chuii, Strain PLY429" /LENGTH=374 /DNA_ID=CAMNT_0019293617 /DNA_START=316 /DNA_END=1437 /DNA_ORIENTATION=+